MTSFDALLVSKTDDGQTAEWKKLAGTDLMDGDVTVRVTHSTINYKDGLVITGKAPVVRRWPMIPGVDFAGLVTASTNPDFNEGDEVTANGCGLGEWHYGGYAQMARINGAWLHHVPEGLTRADCMAIGTAGITSMLAVMALEAHGVVPGDGPVLVTGAAGGVGSVAVMLLAKLGYSVTASSGRPEMAGALKVLGASDIIDRKELARVPRPLEKERWAGAIDVAGSTTLATILAQTRYGGAVAACGLVQGIDLPATVAPFILRAVTLVGIGSVLTPRLQRVEAWRRLAKDLDLAKLHAMTATHPLKDVVQLAPEIVAGKVGGRIVLEVPALDVKAAETMAAAAPEAEAAEAKPEAAPEAETAEAKPEAAPEAEAAEAKPEAAPEAEAAEAKPEAAPEVGVTETKPEAAPEAETAEAKPEAAPVAETAEAEPEAAPEVGVTETEPEAAPQEKVTEAKPETNVADAAEDAKPA